MSFLDLKNFLVNLMMHNRLQSPTICSKALTFFPCFTTDSNEPFKDETNFIDFFTMYLEEIELSFQNDNENPTIPFAEFSRYCQQKSTTWHTDQNLSGSKVNEFLRQWQEQHIAEDTVEASSVFVY